MRTPGADQELAIGFLLTEGIISNYKDLNKIIQADSNEICIELNPEAHLDLSKIERHFYTSSSCGVCGKSSIDSVRTISENKLVNTSFPISKALILSLKDRMNLNQNVFESTGGLHASFLFDLEGNIISMFEDVGRHNALDKVIGSRFLDQHFPLDKCILLLSGRASFELIQKAVMANISIICALGAPSSLAIKLAKEFNLTLIGFLKNSSFNLYHGVIKD